MLLGEWTSPTDRPQRDLLAGAFHFERVSRFQVQFLPQRLRDDHSAGLIDNESSSHFDRGLWVLPSINAILAITRFMHGANRDSRTPISWSAPNPLLDVCR